MKDLELLAPARNIDIGIAAIDCGADAVYIAGPSFGARQAAGNSVADIARLCRYAHSFGARIFVTVNTIIFENELEQARSLVASVIEAGADALIVQDPAILTSALPMHASTQCAIRTPEKALLLEKMGFSRLVLERELSLDQIKAIRSAVNCELEFFVHGALCVCYSGQCYLSEAIAHRSANRGECIQACRSLYDLVDESGKVLVHNKALLSLKDYNLRNRLADLAEAGICSFKIEGRLKNISYVRNVVRDYSMALDELVRQHPESYRRASFGRVSGGFIPQLDKTFNRGYTELFLDGKRGKWASMDAPKSMGEPIGTVQSVRPLDSGLLINIKPLAGGPAEAGLSLKNGDGFAFVADSGEVTGFRGDICQGLTIQCKDVPDIKEGSRLFRNISTSFEKELTNNLPERLIDVTVDLFFGTTFHSGPALSETSANSRENWAVTIQANAVSEDGRHVQMEFPSDGQAAKNEERMISLLRSQISKHTSNYSFILNKIEAAGIDDGQSQEGGGVPFMTTAQINAIRRTLAAELDKLPFNMRPMASAQTEQTGQTADETVITYKDNVANSVSREIYTRLGAKQIDGAYELEHQPDAELMRTKYCIRHELGMCPRFQVGGMKSHSQENGRQLFLLNNGRRLALGFDCAHCEMTVKALGATCSE